ncbi:MAG: DUF721 domain-containing protein [Candidatus Dormibacteria bacterium]
MEHLADLLDPALRQMGIRRGVREAQLQDLFAAMVGSSLAPLCHAVELKRGTLVVATAHTALAHQLQLDSTRLIMSLNESLGQTVIRRLRFTAMETPG